MGGEHLTDNYFVFKNTNNNNLNNKYKLLNEINKGSYGSVFKSYNILNNNYYAIKIIRKHNLFINQSKKEIELLKEINKLNINFKYPIVKYIENFVYNNYVCIVFELLSDFTLHTLLKRTNYNGLEFKNVFKFARQILLATKFIHQKWIHCDLKPNNIVLVNFNKCKLKIIDFGISCLINEPNKHFYVQSLYYRAPEIFLRIKYNYLIDIWSCGCIIGELYNGKPLFIGRNKDEQFKIISHIKSFNEIIPQKTNTDNKHYLLFIDLLTNMIVYQPNKRLNSENLLKHEFLLNKILK